jgi:predicted nucleotidyltransferase component of viral defense system
MMKQWLASYEPKTAQATEAALREIMQEVALAGLYRANFFKEAAFYGGTALRVFYGLDRFSEDLDFSLLRKNAAFEISHYFEAIVAEFDALGMQVSIRQKEKAAVTQVDSAFLKADTLWSELIFESSHLPLQLRDKPMVKIKLEIDTQPPLGFATEQRLLTKPFSFYVNCLTLPDLFAGKMHALLYRKWGNRVKGRDWYDLEWYVRRGTPLNMAHLQLRAFESGDRPNVELSKAQLVELLLQKIELVNFDQAKADIARFIPDSKRLSLWSPTYFRDLVQHLKAVGD